jgi:hypothetical protein
MSTFLCMYANDQMSGDETPRFLLSLGVKREERIRLQVARLVSNNLFDYKIRPYKHLTPPHFVVE